MTDRFTGFNEVRQEDVWKTNIVSGRLYGSWRLFGRPSMYRCTKSNHPCIYRHGNYIRACWCEYLGRCFYQDYRYELIWDKEDECYIPRSLHNLIKEEKNDR